MCKLFVFETDAKQCPHISIKHFHLILQRSESQKPFIAEAGKGKYWENDDSRTFVTAL